MAPDPPRRSAGRSVDVGESSGAQKTELESSGSFGGPASCIVRIASPGEEEMEASVYTLAVWRVKSGRRDEFIAAWKDLGEVFKALPSPPGKGTLVQSTTDPDLFYSFGPWRRPEDAAAMRENPDAQAAMGRLVELCDEATPGAFRIVAETS